MKSFDPIPGNNAYIVRESIGNGPWADMSLPVREKIMRDHRNNCRLVTLTQAGMAACFATAIDGFDIEPKLLLGLMTIGLGLASAFGAQWWSEASCALIDLKLERQREFRLRSGDSGCF